MIVNNFPTVFAKQYLFHSAPWALSLGCIAFQCFVVSDINLYALLGGMLTCRRH